MKAALLPDRGVVEVAGPEARTFLNGILTSDIARVRPGAPRYTALLTPQGKIVVDAIAVAAPPNDGDRFLLDCPLALAQSFVSRLGFYKLRAKVTVADLSAKLGVLAAWGGSGTTGCGLVYPDPRLADLGLRIVLPEQRVGDAVVDLGAELLGHAAYEAHRIGLGVPNGGLDFTYGDAFPHEADMDQLSGIDFDKGCYVGQEVVSRVEHRGIARARIVTIVADEKAPGAGLPVMAGERQIGTTGSASGRQGLALLRLDRLADAVQAGIPLTAGGIVIRAMRPQWARFSFPNDKISR